ncbi:MAG: GTPase HflX [Actinomycetia bacterium]|nr:GTPase HflX [Actinomycetes bacterium]
MNSVPGKAKTKYLENIRDSREKALLIFIKNRKNRINFDQNVKELQNLALSAGADVEDTVIHSQDEPNPKYYISTGKLEQIKGIVEQKGIGLVIIDEEIIPTQQRNLQDKLKTKIIDRTALILDIFAQRAHSREGKLQVELAQLNYLLPRLRGRGIELSRLGGGIGTRGPGETKLEVDRRTIRKRISQLEKKINQIGTQRKTQRKKRKANQTPQVALVGYTNSGKSTLLNTLTQSRVEAKNMLFSTLDSTVRKLKLGPHQHLLLSDTVGFIEKLPHQLIASFKSTLEEVKQSDLLLMVVDISNTNYPNHINSVKSVLREIEAHRKPIICVFNKVDKVDAEIVKRAKLKHPGSVFISAIKGTSLDVLINKIEQNLQKDYITLTVKLPYSKNKLISSVFEHCQVLNKKYLEDSVLLTLSADSQFYSKLSDYIYKGSLSDY